MAQISRIDLIQRTLIEERTVSVSELSRRFHVTEETIRRDLDKLENKGIISRTYGGAILSADFLSQNSIHFNQRSRINLEAKMLIAKHANKLLTNAMVIGADASSTVMEFLRTLAGKSDITVVTNSVGALIDSMQSGLNVLSTGGFLNRNTFSLQGMAAQKMVKNYNIDISFISCMAINMTDGIFDTNEYEGALKNAMVDQSKKVALLVDHSKFDKTSFVKIMDFKRIDYLVTDRQPNELCLSAMREYDVELIY